jgi:hypothetical protein
MMGISSDAVPFYATSRFGIAGWFGYEHFISFLVCFTSICRCVMAIFHSPNNVLNCLLEHLGYCDDLGILPLVSRDETYYA